MNHPSRSNGSLLSHSLGWASVGLGAPQVAAPTIVARMVGVDNIAGAPAVIRGVGMRELAQAAGLLAGPRWLVWTRVVGDALDLTLLRRALASRRGERRLRTRAATAAVVGISALDLYAAARSARDGRHGRDRSEPLHLDASVTVNRSVDEVYGYWRDFTKLPTFMLHLASVTSGEDGRSHWKASAPVRRSVEWDAEMTGDDPNQRISWRSLPGADIDNSGSVHFAPSPDGRGTEVRVSLHYDVPGGRVGRAAAKLFGEEPGQQVRDDLRRFKQVLETGDLVRSDALPQGTDARRQMIQRPAQPVRQKGGRR